MMPNHWLTGGSIQPPVVYVDESVAWEYKLVVRNLRTEQAPTEDELNALGKDGWEMSGVIADLPFTYFYFKRQKS
jgi:hypothetical protein